ncbi:hypothetical protein EMN47_19310 [Prolixibacteraceae bacterium JC049]|nr:hypothetical protein [Prolixibacteraceae bacterium JC049]
MKTTGFKLLVTLCLCIVTLSSFAGGKDDFTREIHRAWLPDEVTNLGINNKYGDITIKEMTGDSVIVDVVITVEDTQEKKANYLLEQIEIHFSHNNSTLNATTEFGRSFKTREKFSVDYFIYIPADRNLKINNTYGHIYLENATGDCNFNVRYGGVHGNKILSPNLFIDSSYSRIDIKEIIDLKADIKYSKLYLYKANNVKVDSKYSVVSVDDMNEMVAESRYDTYRLEKLNGLNLAAKYTGTKIDELNGNLRLSNGYGSFSAGNVANFESISVENQYASIKLGIAPSMTYTLKAYASYCNVKYPETDRMNRMKDNRNLELDGTVGEGTPTATVKIETRYGSISLIP